MEKKSVILHFQHFQHLIDSLISLGYQTIAPTIRDNSIVYQPITKLQDLPVGWIDLQEPALYRLQKNSQPTLFSYTVAANSWKQYLHPPKVRLWQITRKPKSMHFLKDSPPNTKFAFIGVRACELNAISILDTVFLKDKFIDPIYLQNRKDLFIVAVNCARAVNTCFCTSMNTGPKVHDGFDLALTEIIEKGKHFFLVDIHTQKGLQVLQSVPHKIASSKHLTQANIIVENTAKQITKSLDTTNIKDVLYRNLESPSWDEVASRCLTCANCTMVCPTCFCSTVEDSTDLSGDIAERSRRWDSCFTSDFSYIHGGSVRPSTKSRYRQWLVHKLASWLDQFGSSGCVGCGRCIVWCPVGIDITQLVSSIHLEDSLRKVTPHDSNS